VDHASGRAQRMKGPLWLRLGLLCLFVIGVGSVVRLLGFDLAQMTPERVRAFVASFGVWAPAVYLLVYGQPIVPLPASIVIVAAGLAFGPFWGMLAALGGGTLRACNQFAVARWLGQDAVAKLLKGKITAFNERIGERGFSTVLLIRLIPNVPFDVQNYGLGFSQVRFLPYMLATFLGIIPGSFAFVYFGYSLTDPKQVWKLLLALLFIVGLVFAQRAWKASRRQAATGDRRA